MKRCDHSHWLSLGTYGNDTSLLESDRLQRLTHHLQDPENQRPSLFVFIGNTSKSLALRSLFGTKIVCGFRHKRPAGEIHLHLDSSSIFHSRPILIADGELPQQKLRKVSPTNKCHEITRRTLPIRPVGEATNSIYTHLLLPFTDVFCFFSSDIGGLIQIARHIAAWLNNDHPSTLPKSTSPRIIIVTENIPVVREREEEARKAFLWFLREETSHDLSEKISAIDVVALLPISKISAEARYRRLKECLLKGSDEVRRCREETRTLFSATHFAALFGYACDHFSQASKEPFNFIKASRKQNPIAKDLDDHFSIFLKHIRSAKELIEFAVPVVASSILLDSYPPNAHMFEPKTMFQTLYKNIFHQVSKSRVIGFEGTPEMILRTGFINKIETQLQAYFEICDNGMPSSEIHRKNLRNFENLWRSIQSSNTCLVCLRRRPQYGLPCGHIICENCVLVFEEPCINDPWIFKIHFCILCGFEIPEDVTIKIHPPTAGVGVLCIDGGGTRGILPLEFLKRIQDRVGLRIPIQNFFKVIVGTSSGTLTNGGLYKEGLSVQQSIKMFIDTAELIFRGRETWRIPFLSWKIPFPSWRIPYLSGVVRLLVAYLSDGFYSASNIEAALKEKFGIGSILDYSYATSIGAKVGLAVATVEDPSLCLFTNYNGVGDRDPKQGYHIIKPDDAYGRVPFWEIARCASAAPGFFPPKKIDGVGTFQDAGPLENDPLLAALSEVAALFPFAEEPDFMVSLGTGAPRTKGAKSMSVSGPLRLLKHGAFPRLCRMFWERMCDRHVKQVFRTHPRYHRLDIEFDGELPRLDNTKSIRDLQLKAQKDHSVSKVIDNIARCAIASLFYFELDSAPETYNGEYTGAGSIFCVVRQSNPAFKVLLNQLSRSFGTFYLNDYPISGAFGDSSFFGRDGNFRKRVELSLNSRFSISLKQGNSEPCSISGSPFSIEKLVIAQGLTAHFGRADHGKRKRSANDDLSTRKKQKIGPGL